MRGLLASAAVLAWAAVAAPARGGVTISPIAVSGRAAPGTAPGVTYGSFLGHPGGPYSDGYAVIPFINNTGQVAFEAGLAGPGVTAANNRAVFAGPLNSISLVAREGSPAPGLPPGVNYSAIDSGLYGSEDFTVLALSDGGHLAFGAVLGGEGVTEQTRYALFTGPISAPALLARRGQQAPGAEPGVVYNSLHDPPFRLNDAGQVAFATGITGSSAIVGGSPGALGIVARTGQRAPGTPAGFAYEALFGLQLNDAGQIAFGALLANANATHEIHSAVYAGSPASATLVARTGQQAPGLTPGVTYESVDYPRLTDAGRVLFSARLSGPGVTDANDVALFGGPPGSPVLLLPEGSLNRYRAVRFNDTLDRIEHVFLFTPSDGEQTGAIFAGPPDAPVLVARAGDSVPGMPPGFTYSHIGSYGSPAAALNAAGQVAFTAGLSGPGDSSILGGVFLYDPLLGTQLVVRSGELFDIGGGDLREVHVGDWVLRDDGRLVFALFFDDQGGAGVHGSGGVFVATVPEPTAITLLALAAAASVGRRRRRRPPLFACAAAAVTACCAPEAGPRSWAPAGIGASVRRAMAAEES